VTAPETNRPAAMLDTILNLSHYHREHELFYSRAPLEVAVKLQVVSRALKALALKWQAGAGHQDHGASSSNPAARYTGCDDLNESSVIDALGILFMEGEGKPAELSKLEQDLKATADEHEQGGRWLDEAMNGSWESAEALIPLRPLAGVLGDRHRIIVNNWQMAANSRLIAQLLRRAVDLLTAIELEPATIRADLAASRTCPDYVLAAAEVIDTAADLSAKAALLVHDSEPRWRRFRDRVEDLAGGAAGSPAEADDRHSREP
jgi:hypothetical protein